MTLIAFKNLVIRTLFDPRAAALRLIGFGLPRRWLWSALALMSALNAIVYSIALRLLPPTDPLSTIATPPALHSPLLFAVFLYAALVLMVLALYKVGRLFGGRAALEHILVSVCWLQVLRLMLQLIVGMLALVAPALGAIVIFVATLWGIYILVSFIDVAHHLNSTPKAAGVLVVAVILLITGLAAVISLMGVIL